MLGISWISNLHRAGVFLQRHCSTPIGAHHKHRGQRWISEFRKISKSKPRPKKIFARCGTAMIIPVLYRMFRYTWQLCCWRRFGQTSGCESFYGFAVLTVLTCARTGVHYIENAHGAGGEKKSILQGVLTAGLLQVSNFK